MKPKEFKIKAGFNKLFGDKKFTYKFDFSL